MKFWGIIEKQHNLPSKERNLNSMSQGLSRETTGNCYHMSQNMMQDKFTHKKSPAKALLGQHNATSVSNHSIYLLQDVVGSKLKLQNQINSWRNHSSRKRHHCWHRKSLNCASLVAGSQCYYTLTVTLLLGICVAGTVTLYYVLGVGAI